MQNNFFCPVADVIATLHPFHLICSFQFFRHTLGSFHLFHDSVKPFLCLFIQIGKIRPEFPGQDKTAVPGRVVFFQISPVQASVFPNKAVFLRQFQVRDIVIPDKDIINAIFVYPFW